MFDKSNTRAPELSPDEKLKLLAKAEKIIRLRDEQKRYHNTCIEAGFCPRCGNIERVRPEDATFTDELPECARCSQWLEKIV